MGVSYPANHPGHYTVELEFENGSTGTVDLSDCPSEDTVFRSFLNLETGSCVRPDGRLAARCPAA